MGGVPTLPPMQAKPRSSCPSCVLPVHHSGQSKWLEQQTHTTPTGFPWCLLSLDFSSFGAPSDHWEVVAIWMDLPGPIPNYPSHLRYSLTSIVGLKGVPLFLSFQVLGEMPGVQQCGFIRVFPGGFCHINQVKWFVFIMSSSFSATPTLFSLIFLLHESSCTHLPTDLPIPILIVTSFFFYLFLYLHFPITSVHPISLSPLLQRLKKLAPTLSCISESYKRDTEAIMSIVLSPSPQVTWDVHMTMRK